MGTSTQARNHPAPAAPTATPIIGPRSNEARKPSHRWLRCDPSVIEANAIRHVAVAATIEVTPGGTSTRPTVTISPQGPYLRDQRVDLHGTGFQAHTNSMNIGWCRFNSEDPWTEPQEVGSGYATCAYPAVGVQTDADGSFTIDDFPMPSQIFGAAGATCEEPDARCGLA